MALPGVVFFPETLIRLSVYEEHYKRMITAATENDLLVGVFHTRPADSIRQMFLRCEEIGTFGRIVKQLPKPSGAREMVLKGIYRAELRQVLRIEPYPLAQVRLLQDKVVPSVGANLERALEDLIALVRSFGTTSSGGAIHLPPRSSWAGLFTSLVNSVASILPASVQKKLDWLTQNSCYERYVMIRDELGKLHKLKSLLEMIPPPPDDPRLN